MGLFSWRILKMSKEKEDVVNHPKHYTSHPSGVECITVVEYLTYNIGNAIKYLWRSPMKHKGTSTSTEIQDLQKAIWYINREIERLQRDSNSKR
jgi:hypothetical protein